MKGSICAEGTLCPSEVPRGIHHFLLRTSPCGLSAFIACLRTPGLSFSIMFSPSTSCRHMSCTMASADFCLFSPSLRMRLPRALGVSDRPPRVRVPSSPPSTCLIYLYSPLAVRTLSCIADSSSEHWPHMRFVFLRPEVCRRLPSDSTSRSTPLS
jgi:hypothetical protein